MIYKMKREIACGQPQPTRKAGTFSPDKSTSRATARLIYHLFYTFDSIIA